METYLPLYLYIVTPYGYAFAHGTPRKPERRRPSRVPGGSDRAARHRPTSGPSGWAAPAAVGRFHRATERGVELSVQVSSPPGSEYSVYYTVFDPGSGGAGL